jgi:hypothetical protein
MPPTLGLPLGKLDAGTIGHFFIVLLVLAEKKLPIFPRRQ